MKVEQIDNNVRITPESGMKLSDGISTFDTDEAIILSESQYDVNIWREVRSSENVIYDPASSNITWKTDGMLPEVNCHRGYIEISYNFEGGADYFGGIFSEDVPSDTTAIKIVYKSSIDHVITVNLHRYMRYTSNEAEIVASDEWQDLVIPLEDLEPIEKVEICLGTEGDPLQGDLYIQKIVALT